MQLLFRDGSPGHHSFDHLEENHSNRPSITANTVPIVFEGFGWHVDGRANIIIFMVVKLVSRDSKAKVTDFVTGTFMEDIGRFDITV